MGGFASDLRWTLRLLRRRPAFAATIVLTLAIAIGAVAIAYGVATSVLWRPLPFADANRLVFVWENSGEGGTIEPSRVTGSRFEDWYRGATSLASICPVRLSWFPGRSGIGR